MKTIAIILLALLCTGCFTSTWGQSPDRDTFDPSCWVFHMGYGGFTSLSYANEAVNDDIREFMADEGYHRFTVERTYDTSFPVTMRHYVVRFY